jgi:hypothetical protein
VIGQIIGEGFGGGSVGGSIIVVIGREGRELENPRGLFHDWTIEEQGSLDVLRRAGSSIRVENWVVGRG